MTRRFLIVADQTLDSPALGMAVEQLVSVEDYMFFVVVPVTPLRDQSSTFPGSAAMGSSPNDRS
jgi:hypothetical protein